MALQLGILLAIIAMIVWGISDFSLAIASRKAGALRTTLYFFVITAVIFAVMLIYFSIGAISYDALLLIIFVGVVVGIGSLAFSKGMIVGDVSVVAPIAAAWSLVTVTLSLVFLNEHLSTIEAFGVAVIIIGAILVSFRLGDIKRANSSKLSKGAIYALITAVTWGLYYFGLSLLSNSIGWFPASFLYNIPGAIFILLVGLVAHKDMSLPKGSALKFIALCGILNVIGIITYNVGVTQNYTALIAPIVSAAPVVTVIMALTLLREKPVKNQILGMLMVFAGLIMLSL
jgi:bacterial/archaeal transporter family protein